MSVCLSVKRIGHLPTSAHIMHYNFSKADQFFLQLHLFIVSTLHHQEVTTLSDEACHRTCLSSGLFNDACSSTSLSAS